MARYELGFSSYKTVLGGGSVLRWVLFWGWFGPPVGFAWGLVRSCGGFCLEVGSVLQWVLLGGGSVLQWVFVLGAGSVLQWVLLGVGSVL